MYVAKPPNEIRATTFSMMIPVVRPLRFIDVWIACVHIARPSSRAFTGLDTWF